MKKNIFLFVFFISFFNTINAQKASKPFTLEEIKQRLYKAKYAENVLLDFQKAMADLREKPMINEEIPGEIISWSTMIGEFSIHQKYLIQKNKLKEIEAIPKDEGFLKKLNSYVPEESRFIYSSNLWSFPLVTEKRSDNYYLIKVTVKSFNSYPEIPNDNILLYSLEYKTKNFKDFKLVRLKDIHTEKWTDVSEY